MPSQTPLEASTSENGSLECGPNVIPNSIRKLAREIFSRHPIYDRIFSCLAPLSLTRMASVSSVIREATSDFSDRAYNVNRRLSSFVSDPIAFRSLMARTRMVISGSFALQFFDRTHYPSSDLDLYLHPDRSIIEVGLYLEKEGYTYLPESWQLPSFLKDAEHTCANLDRQGEDAEDLDEADRLYNLTNLRAVYTFERVDRGGMIQLMVSRVSPFASILEFHLTCVMNVITYNAAYSLYPYATFEQREALVVNQLSQSHEALIKYAARGWRIIANNSPLIECLVNLEPDGLLQPPRFFTNAARWVCDEKSWVISLGTTGVTPPPAASPTSKEVTWDPVAECGWKIATSLGLDMGRVTMQFIVIDTTLFRWKYTVPDSAYLKSVLSFLYAQGPHEHRYKIYTKDDEEKYTSANASEDWTWWDDVLPLLRARHRAPPGVFV